MPDFFKPGKWVGCANAHDGRHKRHLKPLSVLPASGKLVAATGALAYLNWRNIAISPVTELLVKSPVYASYPAVALLVSVMGMPASATSWKREPFKEGVPLCYRAVFDTEQFVRVKTGLIPEAMEDKWFIYYEEPHLFLHRSWTGQPVYRLTLKSEPKGAEVSEALWSKDIADASALGPDYEVRLLDFLISNLLLGLAKPLPMPPGLTEP
jgi:hypothetical protein